MARKAQMERLVKEPINAVEKGTRMPNRCMQTVRHK